MKALIVALIMGAGCVASTSVLAHQSVPDEVAAATFASTDFGASGAMGRPGAATDCNEDAATLPALPAAASTRGNTDAGAATAARGAGSTGDAVAPAVTTPHRPTYRWQSLVPGAIK